MYLWNHRFSKIPPKNLIDFCPARFNISKYLVHRIFLSRNRIKFFVGILENRWFHKTFSYYLTFNQDVQLLNFCPLSDWYYPRLATAHDFIVTCSNFKILEILLRGLLSAAPSSYVQYVHILTWDRSSNMIGPAKGFLGVLSFMICILFSINQLLHEFKNNYAYYIAQDFCNKFIEVKNFVGCMVSRPNWLLHHWTFLRLLIRWTPNANQSTLILLFESGD